MEYSEILTTNTQVGRQTDGWTNKYVTAQRSSMQNAVNPQAKHLATMPNHEICVCTEYWCDKMPNK